MSDTEEDLASSLAYFAQGLIYEGEEGRQSPRALEAFKKASRLDPKRHRLYSRAAVSALFQNDPDAAIEALEASVQQQPDAFQARFDLAKAYHLVGRLEDAAEQYEEARRIQPDNPALRVEIARFYFGQKDDEKAIATLSRAFKELSDSAPLLAFCYAQGTAFIQSKQPERSVPCFRLLAEHATSQRGQFLLLLGELFETLENPEEAARYYRMATKEESPEVNAFVKLASLQFETDRGAAIATLREADERLPMHPMLLFTLASMLMMDDQPGEAVTIFERLHKAAEKEDQPLSAAFYLHYGMAAERAKKYDTAERVLQECIDVYPDTHEALNYLAYMWAEKGKELDKAQEYVTRALELDPENGAYIDTLGWIYFQKGDYEKALAELLRAGERIKDDPVVTDHVGEALNALGRTEDAIEQWKKSYRLDSSNSRVAEKLRAHGVDPDSLLEQDDDAETGR